MKKLSLSEWTNLAEIVGMIAVVVSLIFVGIEIRQNTDEARVGAVNTGVNYIKVFNDLTNTTEKANLLRRGLADFNTISQDEKMVFDGKLSDFLIGFNTIRTLYLQGELEENFYLDLENNLAGFMRSPGAIVWFESVRDYFPQETNEMFEMLQKKYDGKATMLEYFQFTPS